VVLLRASLYLRLSRQPFGLMLGYYINNILSDLLHSGFYSLMLIADGGPSLGVIYILDRLALTVNNFIFSTTDVVSTQTFTTEDNVSSKKWSSILTPFHCVFLLILNLLSISMTSYVL
jgi:hypothetical protein